MASAEGHDGCITVTWKIENFGLLREKVMKEGILYSSVFKVECNKENTWYALFVLHTDTSIAFGMCRPRGASIIDLLDVSIISPCGEVPLKKGIAYFFIEIDTVFGDKEQLILPNNALTLRCRMRGKTIKNQELCFSSVLYSIKYQWNIQPFDSSRSYQTFIDQDNFLLRVNLNTTSEEDTRMVTVEAIYAERHFSIVNCALSFINGCGNIAKKTCQFPFQKWTCDIEKFPINNKIINAEFQSIVSLHKVCPIVKHENTSEAVSGQTARADDFLLLYREGTFSDATLNTEGKSFAAHRSILAARSPVFRAMFEKDEMSEGRSGVVDIDDVDSDTVDRLLVFLYGEKLEDVQWEEASALYYAADKYDIPSLKQRCVDILKAGLVVENACNALVLADTHSNEELKKYAVDFIRDHQEVFSSSKWEELEERNPRLTVQIFREVYVKKGK